MEAELMNTREEEEKGQKRSIWESCRGRLVWRKAPHRFCDKFISDRRNSRCSVYRAYQGASKKAGWCLQQCMWRSSHLEVMLPETFQIGEWHDENHWCGRRWWCTPPIPALRKQRQQDLCIWVYRMSHRTARATQRNPVLKNQNNFKKPKINKYKENIV